MLLFWSSSSSAGSQDGRAVSGEGESGEDKSGRLLAEGLASFLFFEEDVLKVSCVQGSSGNK